MRRGALLVAMSTLLLVGHWIRDRQRSRTPSPPLACAEAIAVVTERGDRLACMDDEAIRGCPGVRAGFRYHRCVEVGPMAGAVLLSRGQPLSLSSASATDFEALEGVGPALGAQLAAARAAKPVCDAADLEKLPGIGPKRAPLLAKLIRFDDPRCARTPDSGAPPWQAHHQ